MMEFNPRPERTRSIELENGNKINMTRTDPYGAIVLSLEKGQLPENLKGGSYTSWDQAERAAQAYITERQNLVKDARPKIKYKFDPKGQ
jgi:hypothetical protein